MQALEYANPPQGADSMTKHYCFGSLSDTQIHHNYKRRDWNYENKEIQEGLLSLSAENET